jgi:ribosome modulation factor
MRLVIDRKAWQEGFAAGEAGRIASRCPYAAATTEAWSWHGNGRKYHRRIWKGLAGGPCQVGPFRIERVGRWGIVFVLDVAYAAQRTRRRRRTCLTPGGLDAAFERDFQRRLRCASIGTFGN